MRLTKGERFLIMRRRLGWTQGRAGWTLGVSHDVISEFERGHRAELPAEGVLEAQRPELWEKCLIARRRAGLSLANVAAKLHVTKPTVIAWERGEGAYKQLVQFWEDSPYWRK